jgi:hypothetical protein
MPHQDGFAQQSHLVEHGHPDWVIVLGLPKTCLRNLNIHCMCPGSKDASHVVNPRSRLRTKPRPGSAKSEGYLALKYLNRSRMLDNSARCALDMAKKRSRASRC